MMDIAAGIITIITLLLGFYLKSRTPPSQRTDYEKDVEDFDRAIADSDVDAIGELFERLRRESGRDPGGPDNQEIP